jgi:hypothetical protein
MKPRTAALSYRTPAKEAEPSEMTPARRGLLRLGISLVVFGLASLILPLFGLQFRKFQALGDSAWIAGVALMGVGGVVALLSVLRFRLRSMLLLAGGAVAAVVLLVLALAALGWMLQARRRPSFSASPASPPAPTWNTPRPPAAAPMTYEGMVDKYGAGKVVRVTVTDPDWRSVRDAVVFRQIREAVGSAGAKTQTTRPQDSTITCTAGPVQNLDAVAAALDLGARPTIDRATRTITVQLTGPAKGSQQHLLTSRPSAPPR